MSKSIGTTFVEEIMNTNVITVRPNDKLDFVARVFEQRDVNAAPVVDGSNVCIGVITSHDIVEYESSRKAIQNQMKHGTAFDMAHYGEGIPPQFVGNIADEVAFHMTTDFITVDRQFSVSRVARTMCQKHTHHMVVVDENRHPIGVLSSLDILGHILGEPVVRRSAAKKPTAQT